MADGEKLPSAPMLLAIAETASLLLKHFVIFFQTTIFYLIKRTKKCIFVLRNAK